MTAARNTMHLFVCSYNLEQQLKIIARTPSTKTKCQFLTNTGSVVDNTGGRSLKMLESM